MIAFYALLRQLKNHYPVDSAIYPPQPAPDVFNRSVTIKHALQALDLDVHVFKKVFLKLKLRDIIHLDYISPPKKHFL